MPGCDEGPGGTFTIFPVLELPVLTVIDWPTGVLGLCCDTMTIFCPGVGALGVVGVRGTEIIPP